MLYRDYAEQLVFRNLSADGRIEPRWYSVMAFIFGEEVRGKSSSATRRRWAPAATVDKEGSLQYFSNQGAPLCELGWRSGIALE